jgi:hypothetical protein
VLVAGGCIAYAGTVSLDWNNGELAEGLSCYRKEEFFLAHEHWESAWMPLKDPERSFVQGLIQMTVAFHHRKNANSAGAVSLLGRALRRFEVCPAYFAGVNVELLSKDVREWLRAMEAKEESLPAEYPKITLIDQGPEMM